MRDVFITYTSQFLPNNGISNDEMEEYLGEINGRPSKSKNIVLRSNKITNRYYSLDKNGNSTHTNAEMTAAAINAIGEKFELKNLQLLTAATSSPDQIMPSHANMVHGELETSDGVEVISPSGNCCSSMHGLKYSWLSIGAGLTDNAICTGSENMAHKFLANKFMGEFENSEELEKKPILAFEKDFLRWMLSDGASAVLLQDKPIPGEINFKIDWIEMCSYAHRLDTCMYQGADKDKDGNFIGINDFTNQEIIDQSVLAVKQDVKLLGDNIVSVSSPFMEKIFKKHDLKPESISYLLPHLSSEFFRDKLKAVLEGIDFKVDDEKWFTNLSDVGNVGSASIFMMLHELKKQKDLKSGEKILIMVPESARFSYAFCALTVV
jgi:3-oxoacyl-[acyl-carrier-protein] synthase-3